jgi:inosine-uridine nucleoside N-ribohydrolase
MKHMHKVIFDTDPGVDDAMALLFLHRHPQIDLIGVTTVFGNVSLDLTTRNAQFLHREWDIAVPIARGADRTIDPLRSDDRAASVVHGLDGLGNIGVPETIDWPLDPRPGYQFIIDTVRDNPGEVTLIAVGRMTNLALALQADPDFAGLVKEVIVMGGAFDVNGNVTPAAEANIHGDPEAADIIFTTPWKVTIVGLDVTLKTIMTGEYLADMAKSGEKSVQLLSDLSQYYIEFYKSRVGIAGMAVHDSTACVYLVRPDLFTLRGGAVRVVCGGIADGQTIQAPDSGRKFVGTAWDGQPSQWVCTDVRSGEAIEVIRAALVEGRASGA